VKTTVELPDELLIAAKERAAETRTTLRGLVERGLRRELQGGCDEKRRKRRKIRWVTVDGGPPPGLDVSDREKMYEWFRTNDDRFRY
jgi:hypothetical protein